VQKFQPSPLIRSEFTAAYHLCVDLLKTLVQTADGCQIVGPRSLIYELSRTFIMNMDSMAAQKPSTDQSQIRFMHEALKMGRCALEKGEIPVGCVIVEHQNEQCVIIAAGSNQTNESRNGTRHAEIVAIESLFAEGNTALSTTMNSPKGLLSNCDLYVTCEPCIMCAAALSKLGIRKVYFGCHNERFGGNGSILSVHIDAYKSSSAQKVGVTDASTEKPSESQQECAAIGKRMYHNYDVEAGLLKEEAIELFQNFYTSENRRAPEAKRKRKVDKTFNCNTSSALSS
jgi:tRNA-specific adenosine deaminase 2